MTEAVDDFSACFCGWLQVAVRSHDADSDQINIIHLKKQEKRNNVIDTAVLTEINFFRHVCSSMK